MNPTPLPGQPTALERLIAIGFVRVGRWACVGDTLCPEVGSCGESRNVLYAFAIAGEVTYVGKSIQSLRKRMQGYVNPDPTQRTNVRNRRDLLLALAGGAVPEIYVLVDNG